MTPPDAPLPHNMKTPPYDRAKVIENLGGDERLLDEIAGVFIAGWPDSLTRLRTALAVADADEVRSAAHAIKGSIANFSAGRAVEAARQLEMTGKAGDLGPAPAQLARVVAAVEEVMAALAADRRA